MSKNPRSARRDHGLKILARNRIEFDAVPVGLNALAPTPKVRPLAPPPAPKVSLAGLRARLAASTVAVAMVAASLLLAAPASALSKHVFSGTLAATSGPALTHPTGIAVDQSTGDLYVADTPADQRQEIAVDATGGTYTLSFAGQTTPPLPYDAPSTTVENALQALSSIGAANLTVSAAGPDATATGDLTAGSDEITGLATTSNFFVVQGAEIFATGIPSATKIATVQAGKLILSQAATETATGVSLAVLAPRQVIFKGALAETDLPPITADSSGLTGAAATVNTTVRQPGTSAADVEKLSPSGEFILIFGKDVDKTKVEAHAPEAEQNLCTEKSGDECRPGTPGSSPGAFEGVYDNPSSIGSLLFLALDNSPGGEGDLYVGDPGDSLVSKFDSAGHLLTSWGNRGRLDGSTALGGEFSLRNTGLGGIAVNPAVGDLVVESSGGAFHEFNQDGSFFATGVPSEGGGQFGIALDRADDVYEAGTTWPLKLLSPGSFPRIHAYGIPVGGGFGSAIDPATNELYALGGDAVLHYCAAEYEFCPLQESFGAADLSEPHALAVDSSTGAVYVANTGEQDIAVFTAVPFLPDATPSAPSPLTSTAATLTGIVAPAGPKPITACHFEYAPAAAFSPLQVQTVALAAASGAGNLTAASDRIIAVHLSTGTFAPGEPIEAQGIPQGTTITAVGSSGDHGATLTLSAPATASGADVALAARPSGGTFTLSFEGITTGPIPLNTTGPALSRGALAQLFVGAEDTRDFEAFGGPGGPYTIELFGSLGAAPLLTADPFGLTPPGSTVTVTSNGGGAVGGWANDGSTVPCQPQASPGSPFTTERQVEATTPALAGGTAYHFRLSAANEDGTTTSFPASFTTFPLEPTIGAENVSAVSATTAQIHAQIDPGGGEAAYHTSYRVQYVTQEQFQAGEFAAAETSPSLDAGSAHSAQSLTAPLTGLAPDTAYHYRVLASNQCEAGAQCTAEGTAHTFTTLPQGIAKTDPCPNAHVRQQTSAAVLLDCRAYELVSAAHTAGYDVESSLIAGQTPFPGYPQAEDRLLYGVHNGGIPGTGEPTNRGLDPYLATRTEAGWITKYVGIPATATPSTSPFGSPLLEADPGLDAFAFGGPGLCSPCFAEGIETGIPLRQPNGALIQGMAPPIEETSAKSDGFLAQRFSADGTHLLFGSTTPFAPGGNEENGDVSIYDRDLSTGETHAVSNKPGGGALRCLPVPGKCNSTKKGGKDPNGIAALAISSDGSRIVVAQKVSTDQDGNVYWRLYMDVNDSPESIELTPGATDGVLFDGITEDGSRVFFTTKDQSLPSGPASSNLYEAEVTGVGASLNLIASGSGSCAPVSNANGAHWNSLEATNCNPLAIGGGGGVASGQGSIYFLSPQRLEAGQGTQDQPNLYLAAPGAAPRFIATLEPEDPLVLDALTEAETRHTADFQLTPDGKYAAFPSTLNLAGNGEETASHSVLYRYDAPAAKLACVSCTLSGVPSEGDSSLAADGLSLTDAGRVFFNSTAPLLAADTDAKQDVYEWEEQGSGNCGESSPAFAKAQAACLSLVSAGTSTFDSGLLSADAGGKNAYFFTRDSLAPQDENGPTVKVYDAREGGGFPYLFPETDCKASDECHGAASPAPGPIPVGSGTIVEEKPSGGCKKGYLRKHGKCVRKPKHHSKSHHQRASHKRGGAK